MKMTGQKGFRVVVAAAALALATAAGAQQAVSPTDIQRLQDQVYQANSDVSRLRSSDSSLAGRLESELDSVRDEVIYLKVKLRKEGSVNRGEYTDLRDKIDDLRSRARGNANQTLSANRTPSSGSGAGSGSGYGAGSSSGVSGGQVSGSNSGSYGSGSSSAGSSGGATGGVYQD